MAAVTRSDLLATLGVVAALGGVVALEAFGYGPGRLQQAAEPAKALEIVRFTVTSRSARQCTIEGEWRNIGAAALRYPIVHIVFRNSRGEQTAATDAASRIAPLAPGQSSIFDSLVACTAQRDRATFSGSDLGDEVAVTSR